MSRIQRGGSKNIGGQHITRVTDLCCSLLAPEFVLTWTLDHSEHVTIAFNWYEELLYDRMGQS